MAMSLPMVAVATQPHVGALNSLGPALFYAVGMLCALLMIPVMTTRLGERLLDMGIIRGFLIMMAGIMFITGAITAAILFIVGQL